MSVEDVDGMDNRDGGKVEELQDRRLFREQMQIYMSGASIQQKSEPHMRVRVFVVSFPWVAVQFVAIATDIALVILLYTSHVSATIHIAVSICVSSVFVVDIVLRFYTFGFHLVTEAWNLFDTIVVVASVVLTSLLALGADVTGIGFLRGVRAVRILSATRALRRAWLNCRLCLRRETGDTKKRFVSLKHDLDLDLCYITPRLIAMSVPARGRLTSYRNSINDVVRFFEVYHKGAYCIYNLCPELPYPAEKFRSGEVVCFDVQDHTPPKISQFVYFLNHAIALHSDPEKIVVCHCRGGKGRTGSFCCAWLLYQKEVVDAADAMEMFAVMRTDLTWKRNATHWKGKPRLQGVETPSQVRYVGYVDQLLRQQRWPKVVRVPTAKTVLLSAVDVHGMFVHLLSELVVSVTEREGEGAHWARMEAAGAEKERFTAHFDGVSVTGDVRVSFFGRGKSDPKSDLLALRKHEAEALKASGKHVISGKERGCLFYFLFHTSFLDAAELVISATELDKAWKKPEKYHRDGSVHAHFNKEGSV